MKSIKSHYRPDFFDVQFEFQILTGVGSPYPEGTFFKDLIEGRVRNSTRNTIMFNGFYQCRIYEENS